MPRNHWRSLALTKEVEANSTLGWGPKPVIAPDKTGWRSLPGDGLKRPEELADYWVVHGTLPVRAEPAGHFSLPRRDAP